MKEPISTKWSCIGTEGLCYYVGACIGALADLLITLLYVLALERNINENVQPYVDWNGEKYSPIFLTNFDEYFVKFMQ